MKELTQTRLFISKEYHLDIIDDNIEEVARLTNIVNENIEKRNQEIKREQMNKSGKKVYTTDQLKNYYK